MDISNLIGFIANVIDVFIFSIIVRSMCRRENNNDKKLYYVCLVLTAIVFTAINIYVKNDLLSIFLCLAGFFWVFSYFYTTKKEVVLSIAIWLVVAQCVQWVAIGLTGMFFQVNIFSTITDEDFTSAVSVVLYLVMEFLVVYFWLGKKPMGTMEKKFSLYQYVFLFLAFVFFGNSIALFSFLRNNQEISDGFIIYFFLCTLNEQNE